MVDQTKLEEVSSTELEIGFRKMKEILDQKNMDYKVLIFNVDSKKSEDEQDKDADDIRFALSEETLSTVPLHKDDFSQKIFAFLNDYALVQKITLGC